MRNDRVVHLRCRTPMAGVLLVGVLTLFASGEALAQPPTGTEPAKRGLILATDAASAGYTLFAPCNSTTTYLVDLQGQLVHSWPSKYEPGQAVYLLDDGTLLRSAREPGNRNFGGGGLGGRVERLAPDGTVLWEFVYADENHCQHHDIKALPNGHVLLIAWERKMRDEVLAAGRDPDRFTSTQLWPDCVVEVEPQGTSGGRIVWEWHVWDHLVQDVDADKPNYGVVAEHPERVDVNFRRTALRETPAEMRRLRGLGYVGGEEPNESEQTDDGPPRFGPVPGGPDIQADWCHTNSIDYNSRHDQIVLSVHSFNELWVIDHGTTTREAAGHTGGRYGKGGDLLYRWGNPRAYAAGQAADQTLFAQHDVRWVPEGLPDAGHLTVFNNGVGRPDGQYSSIVEITPPIDAQGRYRLAPGKAYEPSKPDWEFTAPNKTDFFSSHISGAERLPNGNTLICSGEQARLFEINAGGKIVWEYLNPYIEHSGPPGAFPPLFGGPRPRDRRPGNDGPGASTTDDGANADRGEPRTTDGGKDDGHQATGRRRPFGPPRPGRFGPPGHGPWGPPGGGPGGGLFRAARLAPDYPGIMRLLESLPTK